MFREREASSFNVFRALLGVERVRPARGGRRSRSALGLRFWRSAAFPGCCAAQVLLAQPAGPPPECRSSGLGRLKGARASAATGKEADAQIKFLGIMVARGLIFCATANPQGGLVIRKAS